MLGKLTLICVVWLFIMLVRHSIGAATNDADGNYWSSELTNRWSKFKHDHGRGYKNAAEENERKNCWKEKLSIVEDHNKECKAGKQNFTLDLNGLADLLPEEYTKMLGFRPKIHSIRKRQLTYYPTTSTSTLPTSVNWTAQGWVGPVQSQGTCGSCWSFSACGAIESQYYNVTRKYVPLSTQNLIDCTLDPNGNQGCEGGNMQNAFHYVKTNPGIDSAGYYPFIGETGTSCKFVPAGNVTSLKGWRNVQSLSESALQQAVALVGPVSAGIDASETKFQLYKSGVYSSTTCASSIRGLNHAILVVGYGTDTDNQQYWLIKNSWGVNWGDRGYMKLARNRNNMCGIASDASFPVNLVPSATYKPTYTSNSSSSYLHDTNLPSYSLFVFVSFILRQLSGIH